MMRPPSIPETAICTASPSFVWSAYDPYSVLADRSPATDEIMNQLTERARIAYALGCSEWVVFALAPLIDDARPLQLLQTFWAFQMSNRFALPDELMEEEWQGPVRGPIDLSLVTVRNTVLCAEDGTSQIHASFAELIPLHVLREPGPLHAWRAHALEALMNFTRGSTEGRGEPVPRELIMGLREAPEELPSDELVGRFLDSVDPAQNPYLDEIG